MIGIPPFFWGIGGGGFTIRVRFVAYEFCFVFFLLRSCYSLFNLVFPIAYSFLSRHVVLLGGFSVSSLCTRLMFSNLYSVHVFDDLRTYCMFYVKARYNNLTSAMKECWLVDTQLDGLYG